MSKWNYYKLRNYLFSHNNIGCLLEKGIIEQVDINALNKFGQTIFIRASKFGLNYSTLNIIVKLNGNLNIQDNQGFTSLMIACKYDCSDSLNSLLEFNVDVNIVNAKGNNALMIAIKYKNYESVKKILDYDVDIDHKNKNNDTALSLASKHCDLEIIKKCIKPDIINIKNNLGYTPLSYACEYNNNNFVKLLLSEYIEYFTVDDLLKAAIKAGKNRYFEIVELLIIAIEKK